MSLSAVTAFITHEARMLDAEDWDAWDALFTPDGVYWMPAAWGQIDALSQMSLIHDDALLRRIRITRYRDPNAFSLQPRPRALRLVANIMLDCESGGDLLVSARLIAAGHRGGVTQTFHAAVHWRLACAGEELRIRLKRVDLIDCDAPRGDIHLYL